MKMVWKSMLLFTFVGFLSSSNVLGTDHADGPAVSNNPVADITDMYAWMQDASNMNLIMNVFPGADTDSKFSDSIQYIFHVNSSSAYGKDQSEVTITCEFDSDQRVTCKTPMTSLITGARASLASGVSNEENDFKIFTGIRNDPAFFDAENFELARTSYRSVSANFDKDDAQCPSIDDTNRNEIRNTYMGAVGVDGTNVPGEDTYKSSNVLSIVIQASKAVVGSGPVYSVWGSTND